jgi:hypothetical protein
VRYVGETVRKNKELLPTEIPAMIQGGQNEESKDCLDSSHDNGSAVAGR